MSDRMDTDAPMYCNQTVPARTRQAPPAPTLASGTVVAVAVTLLATCGACGDQKAPTQPPTTDNGGAPPSAGGAGGPAVQLEDYFPLIPGSTASYYHSNGSWTETVTVEATTHEGIGAYLVKDSQDPFGITTETILTKTDGRVRRVYKDEFTDGILTASISYGVGFTRFDEAWASAAPGFVETPAYIRTETNPEGVTQPPEDRVHTFEVREVGTSYTTASGLSFQDCVVIHREKTWEATAGANDATTKLFTFCRGAGKVKELNEVTLAEEELVSLARP